MEDTLVADIRERLARDADRTAPPEGFPTLPDIPLGRYTDPEFYRHEIEHVFKRRWLFACHASEVAAPGSFKALELPIAPVALVRGRDGVLRAFLNACRHRGAPVVPEGCGTAKNFACPYHAWVYDLSGNLIKVTKQGYFGDIHPELRPLVAVRCEQWGGMVFVNLDPHARALADDLGPLIKRYSDIMDADLRHITTRTWVVECNWKIGVEAFLESYHNTYVHTASGTNQVFNADGVVPILYPDGHSIMFTPFHDIDIEALFPTTGPQLADTRIYSDLNPSMLCFPNSVAPANASTLPMMVWWPLSIDRCRMDVHWYAINWGDTPEPPGWETKIAAFDMVMQEDVDLMGPVQRSVAASAHHGIPLQYKESRIYNFHAELDRQIGIDRIPEKLRIPDVLADHIDY